MPSTVGMKGGGFYDRHSSGQRASIDVLFGWAADAVRAMSPAAEGQTFTLADYACSEGRNSLAFADHVIAALRAGGRRDPVFTIHSDLPTNDFNQLFLNLCDAASPGAADQVFRAAVAGSMYRQLLPAGSIQFASSFNGVLWLDSAPGVVLPTFVVYPGPRPWRDDVQVSPELVAAFSRQAADDWAAFLAARAIELAPGGKLLVGAPARDDEGSTAQGLYDALNDAALDLVAEGRIARKRYEAILMPIYFRTLEELLAPLTSGGALADSYCVDRAELLEVPTPFVVEFERTGDAGKWASEFAGFLRAFSEPIVAAALEVAPNDDAIRDLYARVEQRLTAEPARYRFRYKQAAVLLTRV